MPPRRKVQRNPVSKSKVPRHALQRGGIVFHVCYSAFDAPDNGMEGVRLAFPLDLDDPPLRNFDPIALQDEFGLRKVFIFWC